MVDQTEEKVLFGRFSSVFFKKIEKAKNSYE